MGVAVTYAMIALLLSLNLLPLPVALSHMSTSAGVDTGLAYCIVENESHWDPNLVSKDFDTGLFQIIPSTAEWVAEQRGLESYDLKDPYTNMLMGLWILARYPEWFSTLYLCE